MVDPNKTFKLNKGDSVKCNECGRSILFEKNGKGINIMYTKRCPHCNKVNGYIIKEDGSVT